MRLRAVKAAPIIGVNGHLRWIQANMLDNEIDAIALRTGIDRMGSRFSLYITKI